ncbi:PHA/PHB synthase family protein [Hyphomicrobium sp.]|uniref:PHA/PHB synthase family protein n=1 Tax=Hyphomicrobium sp. TaxID=82 RepID=UPI002E2F5D7F|nr:alpha/beta fold hydrolase [Hyphomicrobium sp.]HEX2842075.1 alpha/beta fold hydrolase [Hyphomicrobium sp.]
MQSPRTAKAALPHRVEPNAPAPKPSRPPALSPQACSGANSWPFERDSYASTALSDVVDRSLHAAVSRLTAGLSPAALTEAYLDWMIHLASSPGKQTQLVEKAVRKSIRLARHMSQCMLSGTDTTAQPCIEPLPIDRRFASKEWQQWPYTFLYQSFLLHQQWWHNATTGVRGVTAQHERVVEFASRQLLDMFSPANFIATNPQVLRKSVEESGMNLLRGWQNFVEDWERAISGAKPVGTEEFTVGGNVAISPGKVIFRNRLIELIQYAPTTDKVRPEPILIIPAWIMKYYILDLSPHNSLVRHLTNQGFTVFMISWKNPDPDDRDLGMQDYNTLGIMAALDAVSAVLPKSKIHAVGYCLGGTLLATAAAAMARDGDDRLQSMTLLAAQTDFSEAGELMLFINESQLSFLEDTMWEQGFLDTKQMAGAFQLLRSNDLIWSRMIHDYLMGERAPMNDLMAWNADATRMPYRMHSEYLRRMFLDNELSEGRYRVGGKPVALTDIRVPIFAVGTQRDHVAPWRSVFKIHLLTDSNVTFLLTSGGHNAGIVSEPGHNGRTYQVQTKSHLDHYTAPDTWAASTPTKNGSWWPEWTTWLLERSGAQVGPPQMGAEMAGLYPMGDAPGTYVMQD